MEKPWVMPDQGDQIAVSSMSADDSGIIPGKTDLRHKIDNGRNPADHLDITIQKVHQLPCAAVEAHIAGKGNGYGTVLWMCLDILHDLITAVLMENHLPRPLYGICHTLCTDQKLRLIKGLLSFQGQCFFRTHADATRETLCDRVRPNSFARNTLASGRDSPSSCNGLPMITGVTPQR